MALLIGIAIDKGQIKSVDDKGLTDEFKYSTVCIHILSGILYKATGMLTVDYANKYLFEPLGIPARAQLKASIFAAWNTAISGGLFRARKIFMRLLGEGMVPRISTWLSESQTGGI